MKLLSKALLLSCLLLLLPGQSGALTVSGQIIGDTGLFLTYIYAIPTALDTFYITFANPFNLQYSVSNLDPGGYLLFSFQDLNNSLLPDLDEPRGFYGQNGVPAVLNIEADSSGVNIELQEPNSGGFTGTISYDGALTGATFVLAHRTPAFSDSIRGAAILLTNTGNGDYTAFVDSFGTYYAYAYMDVNANFLRDADEPYGVYGSPNPQPIEIEPTDFPENINITLEVIDDIDDSRSALPGDFRVGEIFPNPFNNEAVLPFTLSSAAHVTITLFDILGREVGILANDRYNTGPHALTIRAHDYAAGLYFVELQANGSSKTRRMVLLK